jgi:hypothetical protein
MTRMANDYERADHYRDERKHEPRATDPLPLRFEPVVPGAMEIALLVKGLANVNDGARLVEQYAQTVAAEARLDATAKTIDRCCEVIGNVGGRSDAQA